MVWICGDLPHPGIPAEVEDVTGHLSEEGKAQNRALKCCLYGSGNLE